MNFITATKLYISNSFDFNGRASRWEYFGGSLGAGILLIILALLNAFLTFVSMSIFPSAYFLVLILIAVNYVAYIFLFFANLSASIRRMHDVGKSGWNILWGVIPLGGLYVLYLNLQPSETGINIWGQQPEHTKIN